MKLFIHLRSIVLLALLFLGAALQAADLKGKVVDARSQNPILGCYVVIYNLQAAVIGAEVTAEDGSYRFTNLEAATYLIEVSHVSYSLQTEQIELSDATNEKNFALSEALGSTDVIVVSAGRRAEKIADATANIQVVEGKSITSPQEATAFALARNLAGVDYMEAGLSQQQISARGFTSVFTTNLLTLVDYRISIMPGNGGVLPALLGIPNEDIKQIELITGPNSALYGANAGFGVVNIISKDPKAYQGTAVTIAAGNREQLRLALRSSGLVNDFIGYKFTAERYTAVDFPSYVTAGTSELTTEDDPNRDDADFNIENYAVSASAYFYPSEKTSISYTYGLAVSNALNQSNIGRLQLKDFRLWYHQGRFNISDLFGFGSIFLQGYYTANDAGETINLIDNSLIIDEPERFDFELQHNYAIDGQNFITWGATWRDIRPNSGGTFLDDGPDGERIELQEWGAYAQYENEMIENLRFTLAGRFDDSGDFGNAFSPKAALNYRYRSHNFRVSYNEAFGSVPIQPAYGLTEIIPDQLYLRGAYKGFTVVQYDAAFNPIAERQVDRLTLGKARGYEIGYRGVFGEKLLADISAHTTEHENFISQPVPVNNAAANEFVLDDNGLPRFEQTLSYINFGRVTLRGIDIRAEYMLSNDLSLFGSFSYIEAGDFKDVPAGIVTPDLNAPNRTWKGGVRYKNWLWPGAFAELSGRYVHAFFYNGVFPHNQGTVPTYLVVDLDAELPLPMVTFVDTRFGINLRNLLNNQHVEMPGTAELGFLATVYLSMGF
jgi:outer membrane receptor for ferrienterochelin and colicins